LILARIFSLCATILLLFVIAAGQNASSFDAGQLLPKAVGDFRAQATRSIPTPLDGFTPEDFDVRGSAEATYVSPKGERLTVTVAQTQSRSGAYSLLTEVAAQMRSVAHDSLSKPTDIGTASIATSDHIAFYKGNVFVNIASDAPPKDAKSLTAFAQGYAQSLKDEGNEMPVLVKHLPDWETAQQSAIYAVSLKVLQQAVGQQPVLDAISFDAGTEAVTANYDNSRLIIVEYTTPQIAESSDARIIERINQVRASGQAASTAYRRVGNYSVFVFNAQDETAAARLIGQVKYEQRIQWLGQNPFLFDTGEKQHTQKAVSLILGIAKTIGFFVALCLGAGGLVGGFAYMHRRTQQRKTLAESYSDAGGMLRLNLDEMTPQTDPARLLSSGDKNSW
jgi:hypothetical protein